MSTAPEDVSSGVPKRIGKYEIRGVLGHGGFGEVFLGFDPTVGRQVAIKVLSASGDPSSVPRFRTEAMAAGNLHHKNIVTIHELGEDRGTFFIAMEYLDGQDLEQVMVSGRALTLLEKVRIMSQAAEGLHCAHRNGIVHRDVKPANIMVLADGGVKVMDFGIARLTDDASARLTQTGFLVGSIPYMAPEQLGAQNIDARCDIWAFGVIFYKLLCGRHPFDAPDLAAMMYRIMHWEPPSIPAACPECPPALASVVIRLLDKNRDTRYPSLDEVLFDTAPVLAELESRHADRLVFQANELFYTGHPEEAQSLVKRVLTLDPAHEEARALWQQIQGGLKQRSAHVRIEALIEQSEKAAQARDFNAAIDAVESAVRLSPAEPALAARLADLRSVKQRSDLAARLLAAATESIGNDDLSLAFRDLSEAVTAEPGNAEAARLLAEVQAKIAGRELEKRIGETLVKASGLIALQAFDEAVAALEAVAADAPASEKVRTALQAAQKRREEYQRQRFLQAEVDSAKTEIRAGKFEEAIARLEPLAKESSFQHDVAGLLAYARAELEGARRAAGIKEAAAGVWNLVQSHDFDGALAQVETAIRRFPDDHTLSGLRQTVATRRADYQRSQVVKPALDEAVKLEAKGRLEEACARLEKALQQYPADASLEAALAAVRQRQAEQRERERVASLERDLKHADTLIVQGQMMQATQLLQRVQLAHPTEVRVSSLLNRALIEEKRRAELEALRADIQLYLDKGQPERASELAVQGQKEFGQDTQLLALGAIANKTRARKEAMDRASAAVRERKWRVAASTLEAFLKQEPADAKARALLEDVLEQERAERRREACERGRAEAARLMQELRFEDAARGLRTLQTEFPDNDAIRDDLNRAVEAIDRQARRETLKQGRNRADSLLKIGQFPAAVHAFEELVAKFPGDTVLQQELKAAREALLEHGRRERYNGERRRAAELAQERKFDEAIALLQTLTAEFPGDSALQEDLKSVAGARDLQEQRERTDRQVAQLEKLYRKGDAQAVKQQASMLPAESQDARVRELLDWATAELERASQTRARESAESLQGRRKRRFTIGLAVLGIVAAIAILLPPALRPPSGPESLSASQSQLIFEVQQGAAALPQTISIEGHAAGGRGDVRWSYTASDDWVSVVPGSGATHVKVQVVVDSARLTPGTYSGYLLFTAADGAANYRTNVKLIVKALEHPPETQQGGDTKGGSQGKDHGKRPSGPSGPAPAETHPGPQPVATGTTAAVITEVHPPPPPPVTDCGPTYALQRVGTLKWQSSGVLEKGGTLILGGPDNSLAGGHEQGQLPGCEVAFTSVTDGIVIDEYPARADGFRRVKLHSNSAAPISLIELRWKIK